MRTTTILILSLVGCCTIYAQVPFNKVVITPVPGSSSPGNVTFVSPSTVYGTQVQSQTGMSGNALFGLPKVNGTVGQCLVADGLGNWNPGTCYMNNGILTSIGLYVNLYPGALTFDGTNVWTQNSSVNTVTKINASNTAIVGTYSVGNSPKGVQFDGTNIWVCNQTDATLTKLLASTGALLGTYSIASCDEGMTFDGTYLWIANFAGTTVQKINISTGAVVGTYSGAGTEPLGMAFDGTNIWVANLTGASVTEFLASTGAVVRTVSAGVGSNFTVFDGSNVWVTNNTDDTVTKILASSGVVLGTYPTTGCISPANITFDGTYLWIACYTSSTLLQMLPTGQVLNSYPAPNQAYGALVVGSSIWVSGLSPALIEKFTPTLVINSTNTYNGFSFQSNNLGNATGGAATRAMSTPYHNTFTTAMAVSVFCTGTGTMQLNAYTDANVTPITQVAANSAVANTLGAYIGLYFSVLPGNWYQVTTTGSGGCSVTPGATGFFWTEWN